MVITDDVLTAKMAGPAIRAWHIAEALAVEHEVVLATTSDLCDVASAHFSVESADRVRFEELERWCDVAVVQGYLLHNVPELRGSSKVMVFDLYDPLHLEALVLTRDDEEPERSVNVANTVRTLEEQLTRGDFFICASDKQRDLWLGFLAALGRINPRTYGDDATLRRLIDVVPFGLPDDPPTQTRAVLRGVVPGIGLDDDVVIWGGGLYDWFDPTTLIRAIDKVRRTRPQVRLFFLGMRHPKPDIAESDVATEARRLADELGLTGTHVFFNEGWVDYHERQNYLLESDVGREPPPRAPRDAVLVSHPSPRLPVGRAPHRGHRRRRLRADHRLGEDRNRRPPRGRRRRGRGVGGPLGRPPHSRGMSGACRRGGSSLSVVGGARAPGVVLRRPPSCP